MFHNFYLCLFLFLLLCPLFCTQGTLGHLPDIFNQLRQWFNARAQGSSPAQALQCQKLSEFSHKCTGSSGTLGGLQTYVFINNSDLELLVVKLG